MSPLDSPTVRQRPLPATDGRLRGEKLSVDSAEDSSPLQTSILYGGLAAVILWTVISLVMLLVF